MRGTGNREMQIFLFLTTQCITSKVKLAGYIPHLTLSWESTLIIERPGVYEIFIDRRLSYSERLESDKSFLSPVVFLAGGD